ERQRLILHFDQSQSVLGDILGFGRHRGDLVAYEPQDRIEQQALLLVPADFGPGGRAEYGMYARQRLRLGRIDAVDAGVRLWAAQLTVVELPREEPVGRAAD